MNSFETCDAAQPESEPESELEALRRREVEVLARTLYGEARGETVRGIEAVACVIVNRANRAKVRGHYWWGDSIEEVCTKAWQFSCWNENDPNRAKILAVAPGHRVFDACVRIARRAASGCLVDVTKGATHYHTKTVTPLWSRGRGVCAEIGQHLFYNDIE
jgi:spore germination cell wall hydrolase CwlJ-like protein